MPRYTSVRSGFRCLLIDYNQNRFTSSQISRRLKDFYLRIAEAEIRQRKAVADSDLSMSWVDEPLDDYDIPRAVERRIMRRVERYMQRAKAAAGVDHLKAEDRERLKPVLGGVQASYIDEAGADALAADLHDRYPWMSAATEHAWLQLRQAARKGAPASVGPLLLDGPPGVGKSAWSRSLASLLCAPHTSIDAAASNAGFAVSGTEKGWGTAQAGRPVELILQHAHAGPVIVVDEVCKAGVAETTRGVRMSIVNSLLGLLEPVSASRWECPFFRVPWDLSSISWILTSNNLDRVPEPLRTRCTIVKCKDLTSADLRTAGARLADEMGLSPAAQDAALETIERLPGALQRPVDLRDVRRIIDRAQALETRPTLH